MQDCEPGVSAIKWFASHGLHSVSSDPLYVPGAQGSEGRKFHQCDSLLASVFSLVHNYAILLLHKCVTMIMLLLLAKTSFLYLKCAFLRNR